MIGMVRSSGDTSITSSTTATTTNNNNNNGNIRDNKQITPGVRQFSAPKNIIHESE